MGDVLRAAGRFKDAQESYAEASKHSNDQSVRAANLHKAYLSALEQRHWDEALAALREAANLEPHKYAPFPLHEYQPKRILGAGGFGAVFLCQDTYMQAEVVIKGLYNTDMERSLADAFREAHVLRHLSREHPSIVGVQHCSYADESQTRPYIVMDYFPGVSLQSYLDDLGEKPLPLEDFHPIAWQIAVGMQAAHGKGVLHRDLKPDNVLVKRGDDGWQVRIIDFGLAIRTRVVQVSTSVPSQERTLSGESAAGTAKYASPEQMGELPGVKPGPYSDVYAFGKLCCYMLFRDTDLGLEDWASLPEALADMLNKCTKKPLAKRYASFEPVLTVLRQLEPARKKSEEGEPQLGKLVQPAPERTQNHPMQADSDAARALSRQPELRSAPLTAAEAKDYQRQWADFLRIEPVYTNAGGMKFMWCPPGTFLMGSPSGQGCDNERPQHRVTITKGFFLGVHQVTQAQWQAVMGSNPSHFKGDNRPVENVSWKDCQEFCRKLGERDGKRYRLPTEAEWEYACRAGTTTEYSFGDVFRDDQANSASSFLGAIGRALFTGKTTPVGKFQPNAWGLFDMHGNVWEWCQDGKRPYSEGDIKDPIGPQNEDDARLLRGGSWCSFIESCRAAYRYRNAPGSRVNRFGFRVCFRLD